MDTNPSLLNMRAAMTSGDSERMTLSWFVMQELARMISSSPMMMAESEDTSGSTTSLPSGGFAGTDWSEALANNFVKGQNPMTSAVSAGHAARAYTRVTMNHRAA
jgi:hypothetical protein